MIKSILDTDLYKLTMMAAIVNKFPHAQAQYTFINRGGTKFPHDFHVKLQELVEGMRSLALTPQEKSFLGKMKWLKPPFLDLLEGYRFNPDEVSIDMWDRGNLSVSIDGPWYRTVLFEVPLMALISELYFRETKQHADLSWQGRAITKAKTLSGAGVKFADFGTRRRFSYDVQDGVVGLLKEHAGDSLVGTSNVHLAMKYGIPAIGTQAHEWISGHAAVYGYRMANQAAMDTWVNEFGGDLGIALPDTFTTDVFLESFDKKFARLFDGARQDSGPPLEFADKLIAHYESLGIDPMTKTIVFSDSLDCEKILEIERHCQGRIRTSYGVGTHFSNDVGAKPLNMVIKLTALAVDESSPMIPCVKLSDVPGKNTGEQSAIDLCKQALGIE